jgi:hypothetical protein
MSNTFSDIFTFFSPYSSQQSFFFLKYDTCLLLYCAGGNFNDLYVYDPSNTTWTNLSAPTYGTPPAGRYGHGFTSAGGKLYVHAGTSDPCKDNQICG